MATALAVTAIEYVEEVQPAVFEIVVTLEEGPMRSLRMSAQTLKSLMAQIALHTIA